jgi:hypothetical protein
MRRPLRSAFVLGVLAGLVLALIRALTREARPGPAPLAAPAPPLPAGTRPARTPVPVEVVAPPPATAPGAPDPATPEPPEPPRGAPDPATPEPAAGPPPEVEAPSAAEPEPTTEAEAEPAPETAADGGVWVEPVDGACPDGFPIKAKVASGIYHRPGGLSYARTKPDRCYADEAAAAADGFRAARR